MIGILFIVASCSKSHLDIAPPMVEIENNEASVYININASGEWRLQKDESSWLSASPLQGTGDTEVMINIESNFKKESREAILKIELKDGSLVKEVKVVQQGNPMADMMYQDDQWILVSTGKNDKSPKIVFMGDGYIESDHIFGGQFDKDLDKAIEVFFSLEPFLSLKEYFTVYKYANYSKERGISEPHKGINKNTVYGVYFNDDHTTEINNDAEVFKCVRNIPGISASDYKNVTVNITANINRYGGRCFMQYDDPNIGIAAKDENYYEYLVIHESGGHAFGLLADEYESYTTFITDQERTNWYYYSGTPGMFRNVSMHDNPDLVSWKQLLGKSGYESTGIFEGGYYYKYGVWRSSDDSVMRGFNLAFNAYGRYLIYERTMSLSGETSSWDDFFVRDVATKAGQKDLPYKIPPVPLPPPVVEEIP